MTFKYADYVLEPGSPNNVHTFALIGGKDTYDSIVTALGDSLAYIKSLVSVPLKLLDTGETVNVMLTKMLTGDLCFLNSICGLSTCSSSHPCAFCLIAKEHLGDLVGAAGKSAKDKKGKPCKKYPERTLSMQNGFSHGHVGAQCGVCGKVDEQMVAEAREAYEDPKQRKGHRLSHFGYTDF